MVLQALSTGIIAPLIFLLISEARKSTMPTISSGCAGYGYAPSVLTWGSVMGLHISAPESADGVERYLLHLHKCSHIHFCMINRRCNVRLDGLEQSVVS